MGVENDSGEVGSVVAGLTSDPKYTLLLTIEVPGIWADDLPESAALWADSEETGDKPTPEDYLNVVIEEWFREEVGLTIVTLPGEKTMNDDFGVHAYTCRIVGAGVKEIAT